MNGSTWCTPSGRIRQSCQKLLSKDAKGRALCARRPDSRRHPRAHTLAGEHWQGNRGVRGKCENRIPVGNTTGSNGTEAEKQLRHPLKHRWHKNVRHGPASAPPRSGGSMFPKTSRVTFQTRCPAMMRGGREVANGHGGISIHRHLTELQVKILSKHTFKIGVAILTSLILDRYSSASRAEQRQIYSTVSRVATLLTTQFTAMDFWTVGLSLFQAAASVITQLDELMHMRACIDLSQKFLSDDRHRKEVLAAAAILPVSAATSTADSEQSQAPSPSPLPPRLQDQLLSQLQTESPSQLLSQSPSQLQLQVQSGLSNLLAESMLKAEAGDEHQELPEPELPELDEPESDLPPEGAEDVDLQLARAMTMEDLGQEIQAILRRVNLTFTGRSQALAEEFSGLQKAIQATLQEINNGPRGPPPAAKDEIEKMALEVVTDAVVARIGESTECAVCREALAVGEVLQQMPCLHAYHPDCLRPWLVNKWPFPNSRECERDTPMIHVCSLEEKQNSCPICRFELRTDDEDYERQKQEGQAVEEQRRRVQIALKEDELMHM